MNVKRLVIELPQGPVLNDPNAPPKPPSIGKPAPEGYTDHGTLIIGSPPKGRTTSTAIAIHPSLFSGQLFIFACIVIILIQFFFKK